MADKQQLRLLMKEQLFLRPFFDTCSCRLYFMCNDSNCAEVNDLFQQLKLTRLSDESSANVESGILIILLLDFQLGHRSVAADD